MAHDASKRTKASRKERIQADQEVHSVKLAAEATAEYRCFEETISTLYGPTVIGKTTFEFNIPDMYVLATEPINNPNKFRGERIENWPTFKHFIDEAEKHPSFVKTVSMWGVDTIDALVAKCMSSVCFEWGLTNLSDEGFSRAWQELKDEVVFNLLRLRYLGPGLLLLSHERQREFTSRRITLTKDSMDLSNSICNAISYLSAIIMHMRYVDQSKTSAELGHMRCISIIGSEEEDAKDNTGRLLQVCSPDTGVIKFKTEDVAVRKILSCFKDTPVIKKHKKCKKVKKAKKKSKKKARR